MTATAEIADVVFPASADVGRVRGHGHELRAAGPARPRGARAAGRGARRPRDRLRPGAAARPGLGRAVGRARPGTSCARCRRSTPGCPTRRLEELGGLQWPCYDETHPGELFLHSRLWERPGARRRGRRSRCVHHDPPVDRLDDEFPIRLTTGRRLDSYNTGVQTGELLVAAAAGRDARPVAGGRRRARPRRGRAWSASARAAARSRRRSASTRPAARARVHDAPLPGRGRDEPADDRRDGPRSPAPPSSRRRRSGSRSCAGRCRRSCQHP